MKETYSAQDNMLIAQLRRELAASQRRVNELTRELTGIKASVATFACVPAVITSVEEHGQDAASVLVRVSVPAFEVAIPMAEYVASREGDPKFSMLVGYAALHRESAPVPLAALFEKFNFHDGEQLRRSIEYTMSQVLKNVGESPIVVDDPRIRATLDSAKENES